MTLSLAFISLLASAFPGSSPPLGGGATVFRDVGYEQHLDGQMPLDVDLRDETGQSVRFGDLLGSKPTLLVFVQFRCPMLCGEVLHGLLRSLRGMALDKVHPLALGENFQVLTISFDSRETPELGAQKKAAFVEDYGRPGAAAAWHFLTADQLAIDRLTQAAGFRYVYDPKIDQFAHASGIVVLTPKGKISRYFFGIDYPPRYVGQSLEQATDNKIGSPIHKLLLLCYNYDHLTGKYSLAVMKIIRLGGLLTVAALVFFLLRAWRQDRRRTRNNLITVG